MFVDFGARPPEVNASLIYGGDGAATMLAAATAWDGLAMNLSSTAASYKAVISRLTGEEWLGPSAMAMAAKVTPHALWMEATATQAEQTAIQAKAAAAAFDAAFAATTPPPVIAANRAQQAALVATNVLGQNTAAIMATEALYMEMWAQCAAAMYGYAAAASAASQVTPFSAPTQTPDPAGRSLQDAAKENAVANSGGQGLVGQTLSKLFDSTAGDGLFGDVGAAGLGPNANLWNTITSTGMINPAVATSMIADMAVVQEFNEAVPGRFAPGMLSPGSFTPMGPGVGSAIGATSLVSATSPAGLAGSAGASSSAVTAGLGRAVPVGTLSVPASWSAASPAAATANVLPGHSPAAAAPMGGHGAPGVPLAGASRGAGVTGPRYGIRPVVMARPPAAGYAPDIV
ncbi:PPE family protein [Mycobacterium sp. 1274756.6]|uniref:PPE family protein n=1 Tax=Mycobacterium sp. 1274756.6 TaxID=1834076 RepID=UPI0007FC7A4A|nr:PPE family protein [Mycobacterium sp. 1274756.6]OBJ71898.1 hypothetical protein A5643_06815 [Mycobacterium sp. 1274756.6]